MEDVKVVERDTTQYVMVCLGEEKYGIDIMNIDNIVRMQQMTRVPKAQEYVNGVINLRGEVVPVMSIRKKMHLAEDEITKANAQAQTDRDISIRALFIKNLLRLVLFLGLYKNSLLVKYNHSAIPGITANMTRVKPRSIALGNWNGRTTIFVKI